MKKSRVSGLNSNRSIIIRLFSILFILTAINACKDEIQPTEPLPENYFTYDGKTYPLDNGWIKNIEFEEWGYSIIALYSSGLTWVESKEDFTGKGSCSHLCSC